ncbi:MAG: HAMP domain-containing sensor histidine kinase [Chloroflexi bacterium]|nr:HAMP domain-containing sensor histidine kinase [Chloroflexota bacterium]MDA1145532.1 HAMP domain-containing sensor histidine kinase [Chloroflexota bacterium]
MLGSFRARLLAGFGIVILLTLFLSASAFVLLLREQQAEAAEQRIGILVGPINSSVERMELQKWPRSEISTQLVEFATYYDIRILMLDSNNEVLIDTDPEHPALGEVLELPDGAPAEVGQIAPFQSVRMTMNNDDLYFFRVATTSSDISFPRVPGSQLVLAVPAGDVNSAWAALLPRLTIAGVGAGVVAVLFAFLFAARITTPVRDMTRASQAMARGDLNQRIRGEGDDEIGRLAAAFNQMSTQVARSNSAMRDLIANVSHELKTPLTSIQGFGQAMVDGLATKPEDYAEMSGVIVGETERIRVLVDDLLYLSQLESGTLQLNLDRVGLDAIVADAAARFRFQADEAAVSLRLVLDGPTVRADGRRLEQVLANLVDNAIRFAPSGSEVLIRTYALEDEAAIEVNNGGEPIPKEGLAAVFDRFYQVDPARAESRHSGLGLSIVQELVQAHGGSVHVQSSRDAGTTFSVWLPIGGPGNPEASPRP